MHSLGAASKALASKLLPLRDGRRRRRQQQQTHTLKDLLPADILKTSVQVLDAGGNVLHLALVVALDLVGLADDEVDLEPDAALGVARAQPVAAARGGVRCEADLVVARLGGGEGEAAGGGALLVDDAVILVKDFLRESLC